MEDLGINYAIANNGVEVVEMWEEHKPILVLMDISMPKMDGKEATQEIRKIEAANGGHIPIVALTAHAMEGDEQGILAAGLDHYLTKPLRKAAIHGKIGEFCPTDAIPPVQESLQAAE